jgi:hypothetical protein
MDRSYAVVYYIAAVPNEATSYTADAKPKTGGEGNSDNYANPPVGIA